MFVCIYVCMYVCVYVCMYVCMYVCNHSLQVPPHICLHNWVTLTHWGRVTHICVSKLTIIGSDTGLSPDRRQAIIWINAGLLLIGYWGTNFSEILIGILTFSFKKMRLKVSSAKWRLFGLGLNELTLGYIISHMKWHLYFLRHHKQAWVPGIN